MKKIIFCNLVIAVIDFNNITTIPNIKACRSVFSSSSVSTDPLWGFDDEVSHNSTVDFNSLTIHYMLPVVLFCSRVKELSNCKNLDKHRQDMRSVSPFFPIVCNGHIWVAYESGLFGFLQLWMISWPYWKNNSPNSHATSMKPAVSFLWQGADWRELRDVSWQMSTPGLLIDFNCENSLIHLANFQ